MFADQLETSTTHLVFDHHMCQEKGAQGFAVMQIFILSCGIAVLQNHAVCGIWKFSSNFKAVCRLRLLFCVVSIRNAVHFCGICTPLMSPYRGEEHLTIAWVE